MKNHEILKKNRYGFLFIIVGQLFFVSMLSNYLNDINTCWLSFLRYVWTYLKSFNPYKPLSVRL